MEIPFIAPDDIPSWTGHTSSREGGTEYELKYGTHEKVSMMQAMLGQRGPKLEAGSGCCLVIAVYVPVHGAGLLIHLWRNEELSDEEAELIRMPFEKFLQLTDSPIICMLSSNRLDRRYPMQMEKAERLIATLAPKAKFKKILATERKDSISVNVVLDTVRGHLNVEDEFGINAVVDFDSLENR